MPIRPPEFDSAAQWLQPVLENLPPKLVVITGPLASGKTTLGRFLAWYFNISLIESDHYLVPNKQFVCDSTEINRIIEFRLGMPRPVIVEGFRILPLIAELKRTPDAIIHVRNRIAHPRATTALARDRNPTEWGFGSVLTHHVVVSHNG